MRCRPPKALGIVTGLLVAGAIVGLAVVLAVVLADAEMGALTVLGWAAVLLLGVVLLFAAYWLYALATLSYAIDRDYLNIRWGFVRTRIPLPSIERLVPGRTQPEPRVRGVSWFGCRVGAGNVPRFGRTLFYSTHRTRDDILYVVSSHGVYGLTVLQPAEFAEEIQNRQQLGARPDKPFRVSRSGPAALEILHDRWSLVMLGGAILLNALLFAYLAGRWDDLPSLVAVDFPRVDDPRRTVERDELLNIPLLGLAFLALNVAGGLVAHVRERSAALVLFGSAALIQALLLTAAVLAVEQAV